MNGLELKHLISLAENYIVKTHDYINSSTIKYSMSMHLSEAESVFDNYLHIIEVNIGIIGLEDDKEYSDYEIMLHIVGMFHEVDGHCEQVINQHKKSDALSQCLALNHYACKASSGYYMGENLSNYFNQPSEIAAQYAGIYKAYEFCCAYFGENKAEDLLLNYVNTRVSHDSEFIGKLSNGEYESIDEVYDAFDRKFKLSMYSHRQYFDIYVNSKYGDAAHTFFNNNPSIINELKVKHHSNGAKQDMMLASMYLQEYDKNGYLSSRIPALGSVKRISDAFKINKYMDWMSVKDRDVNLENILSDFSKCKKHSSRELPIIVNVDSAIEYEFQ